MRAAEKSATNLICLVQRSQQVVDKITEKVDEFPSEWSWAKSFLSDFNQLQEALKGDVTPDSGDDLAEFVDELKLSVISPLEGKAMKKRFGSRYFPMLTLFTDRCTGVANQYLDFREKLLQPSLVHLQSPRSSHLLGFFRLDTKPYKVRIESLRVEEILEVNIRSGCWASPRRSTTCRRPESPTTSLRRRRPRGNPRQKLLLPQRSRSRRLPS